MISSPSSTVTVGLQGADFDKNLPWAVEARVMDPRMGCPIGSIWYVRVYMGICRCI